MKRALLLLIFPILSLSCKKGKDEPSKTEDKIYRVTFSTSGFTQSLGNISSIQGGKISAINSSDPVSGVNHIYCLVYKETENILVKNIHQIRGTTQNFGTVVDSLPQGRYRIAFLASKDPISISTQGSPLVQLSLPGTDLFHETILVDVAGQINRSVTLERIVSLLQIQLEDNVPFAVNSIDVTIEGSYDNSPDLTPFFYALDGTAWSRGLYERYTRTITEQEKGTKLTLDNYIWFEDIDRSVDVSLSAYDFSGTALNLVSILNVKVSKNKKTILKGTLFDKGGVTGGAIIKLQDLTWGANPTISF